MANTNLLFRPKRLLSLMIDVERNFFHRKLWKWLLLGGFKPVLSKAFKEKDAWEYWVDSGPSLFTLKRLIQRAGKYFDRLAVNTH